MWETERTKYVIVESETGIETAMTFGHWLKHIEAAFYYHRQGMVVAAGFYFIDERSRVIAHGKSDSLKIASRGDVDAILINAILNGTGTPPVEKTFACDGKLGERCPIQCEACRKGESVLVP